VSRSILVTLAKYGLGIGLLAYVIWQKWTPAPGSTTPGLRDALLGPIQVVPLAMALLLAMLSILLTFLRWFVLVRGQDLPVTMADVLRLGMIGFFFNNFLPGSVSGDVVKAGFLVREQSRRTVAVATVLLDRAVGLWGLVWLVALSGGAFWALGNNEIENEAYLQYIVEAAVAIVAATVVVWALLGLLPEYRAQRFAGRLTRIPKLGHAVAEFWRAIWMYRCRRGSVAVALLLAIIGHVGFVLTFYCAAQIFMEPGPGPKLPSLAEHFLLVPQGMAMQAFFPTPGGIGGGELIFGWLYAHVKPEWYNQGVLGSLAQHALYWLLGFGGYLVYLRMKPALRVPESDAASPALATAEA
jgi:uncharacterized protein (TIRG00374 family)